MGNTDATEPLSDVAGGTLQIVQLQELCTTFFIYAKSLPFRGEQRREETTGGALNAHIQGI